MFYYGILEGVVEALSYSTQALENVLCLEESFVGTYVIGGAEKLHLFWLTSIQKIQMRQDVTLKLLLRDCPNIFIPFVYLLNCDKCPDVACYIDAQPPTPALKCRTTDCLSFMTDSSAGNKAPDCKASSDKV